MPCRRSVLVALFGARAAGAAAPGDATALADAPAIALPADFGAHPSTAIEWWYVTGALETGTRLLGFQITFFRASTPVARDNPSRFAARQLLFAHAAVSDLDARRLRHDQRIARTGFRIAEAAERDTQLVLDDWRLARSDVAGRSRYATHASSDLGGFAFDLVLDATQPVLLQGEAGLSRKGPRAQSTSRYYSEPQLAVVGTLALDGRRSDVRGRAWLDHEWSDAYLDADAVGWDWIGMNLDDGGALTAFRIRRRDGSALWAGGSFRAAGRAPRDFGADEVSFVAGRTWQSPASGARYPVEWRVTTPAGRFVVSALLDAQELDSRASTGAIYWEGLSSLADAAGRRVGRGYLEMTGYAARLVL